MRAIILYLDIAPNIGTLKPIIIKYDREIDRVKNNKFLFFISFLGKIIIKIIERNRAVFSKDAKYDWRLFASQKAGLKRLLINAIGELLAIDKEFAWKFMGEIRLCDLSLWATYTNPSCFSFSKSNTPLLIYLSDSEAILKAIKNTIK
jgi:hypothetical protein